MLANFSKFEENNDTRCGAVLVQFQISKFSRITRFIKFTKLQITIFSKTNFDEITNLTGPTKFGSLADSGYAPGAATSP